MCLRTYGIYSFSLLRGNPEKKSIIRPTHVIANKKNKKTNNKNTHTLRNKSPKTQLRSISVQNNKKQPSKPTPTNTKQKIHQKTHKSKAPPHLHLRPNAFHTGGAVFSILHQLYRTGWQELCTLLRSCGAAELGAGESALLFLCFFFVF